MGICPDLSFQDLGATPGTRDGQQRYMVRGVVASVRPKVACLVRTINRTYLSLHYCLSS